MSDEHKDPSHKVSSGPGHEVDAPPTKELFNIVWGLGGLTLLSIATCAQLFYRQGRDLEEERAKVGSYQLAEYRKEMNDRVTGSGALEFKDASGTTIKQRYQPLAATRDAVLARPDLLKAAAAPPGWVHPDDIAAGGQGGNAGSPAAPAAAIGDPSAPNPAGVAPAPVDPAAPGLAPVGAPSGSGVNHPLGDPAVLPPGTGPADPTSAEAIKNPPVEAPPPTPSVPAANPAPAPAPPVTPEGSIAPAGTPPTPAQPTK